MLRNLIRKIPTGVCTIATTALILWLTLAPHPTGDVSLPLFEGADKVVHALMFGFLTWMFHIDLHKMTGGKTGACGVWMCVLAALLIGVIIEWLQHIMALGRSMEVADIIADGAGAVCAAIVICLTRK